ncbi:pyrophosphatase [Cephaloticoccus primus]|uniref:inorganic diphosphatase n=1 Tax=Cephaloticoccus primus TaxID=1548207 RepID=A0A139SMI4_9BACT|nr:putative manganese-dependent inorganic diphosphatase [Cephaloticoccus primus]KXU35798.1 pyrophosphatase [Cephaloticoccus primus]
MTAATASSAPTPPPDPREITYVIGHKNPDADAICAAIAYAAFKQQRGEPNFVPARCGNSNARIDTILRRFNQPLPLYLSDVRPRVHDLMVRDVIHIQEGATCVEALEAFERHGVSVLPITDPDRKILGTLTLAQMGGFFVPHIKDPRRMREVYTSLSRIVRSLSATILTATDEDRLEPLHLHIAAMDIGSFWKISEREKLSAAQSITIVGDRRDVQLRAIEIGSRALIISGGRSVDPDVVELAAARQVSIISSPHDTATTAWIVRAASTLDGIIERNFDTISAELPLSLARKKFSPSSPHAVLVADEQGTLQGILTKSDLLRPVGTRLVLVDHNEITQAVPGAEQARIVEIIDHHRLGPMSTQQPILFINEPVGSTCTIVADLYRRAGLSPSPDLAGIMMSGLVSDTLMLKGPTATPKDAEVLGWLSQIAGVDPQQLADQIFSSGSVILASPAAQVVRADFKIYSEEGVRFSVSQVEELGFSNFWKHAEPISDALQELLDAEGLSFSCLLVTDINTQNSILLVKGDSSVISRITYPHVKNEESFDLPGIVSRKKQLIPYLGSLLREMASDEALPAPRAPRSE